MPSACPVVSTDLLIAMPVTSPHDRIAISVGEKSRKPCARAKRSVADRRASIGEAPRRRKAGRSGASRAAVRYFFTQIAR